MEFRILNSKEMEEFKQYARDNFSKLEIQGVNISVMHPAVKVELARLLVSQANRDKINSAL